MINSKDLLAKLLASENIDVIRCKSKTASFDVENRVLRLPQYTNISEDVEDMLIGHEVGHALFTDDKFKDLPPLKKKIHNIVEDNRIERLIKNRYIGLRPIFLRAYSEMFKRGFMGDGVSYNFLDKINVHGKVGLEAEIKFENDYERELMSKVEQVTTNEQVYKLVDVIYDYVVQQKSDNRNETDEGSSESEKSKTKTKGNKKSDKHQEPEDTSESSDIEDLEGDTSLEDIEQEILEETTTYDMLEKEIAKNVDMVSEIRRISFDKYHLNYRGNDNFGIVSSERLIKYMNSYFKGSHVDSESYNDKFEEFYKDVNSVVSSMVKEFNLHKSADEYKRTATHKTGELNFNKLYAYRITDNIFKSVAMVKSGKNHGLIVLLDMSSSMSSVIHDVFVQVIHLALFCKRIGVPYSILGFSNTKYDRTGFTVVHNYDSDKISLTVEHLEFFKHDMTDKDFKHMCKMLYLQPRSNAGLKLYLTPLDDSLFIMNTYTEYFKNKYKIDKMNLTVLTDGEADRIGDFSDSFENDEGELVNPSKCDLIYHIHDRSSKRHYKINSSHKDEATKILLKSIKDKMDINITFIFISSSRDNELIKGIDNNINRYSLKFKNDPSQQITSVGYAHLNSNEIDNFYITTNDNLRADSSRLSFDGTTVRELADKFIKASTDIKRNRLMLTHFVKSIA